MDIRQEIVDYARMFAFIPYNYGGDNPLIGLDCSQACIEWYRRFGIYPPHADDTAAGLLVRYKKYRTQYPHKAGLAFWVNDNNRTCHVALIIGIQFDAGGNKDVWVIEASGRGAATVSRETAIKHRAYIKERPLGYDRGLFLVGYVDPIYENLKRYRREV